MHAQAGMGPLGDMPMLSKHAYATSVFNPQSPLQQGWIGDAGLLRNEAMQAVIVEQGRQLGQANIAYQTQRQQAALQADPKGLNWANPVQGTNMRIVKVFIADSDVNLPLEKRLLYKGEEQLTDLTDQELFYEVPITALLAEHNKLRAGALNKSATEKAGRDVYLEPVRIRDLRMVVVDVASF